MVNPQAKFFGPYINEKRIGEVNYVVRTPDRRKSRRVIHVNLLKKYIARVTDTPSPIAIVTVARYFGMGNSPPFPWITWSWSSEGNCNLSWCSLRMCSTTSPVVRQLWSTPLNWYLVLDPLGRDPIGCILKSNEQLTLRLLPC